MGKLTIYREPRYSDKIRSYNVVVDGQVVGKIKERETFEFALPAGLHEIWLTIDWASSNRISCNGDGEVNLICQSNVKPLFALFALFNPKSWIALRFA